MFLNFEINVSNPRARIFKLNGLHASDYDPKKQQQLLEGLLKESEDFWGHSRSEQVNKNLPELSRFFYRTLVESKDETEQKEENLFELSSEISAKALKNLNQPTIKLENPEKMELQQLARTSSRAVKRLEGKQSELSALLIAMEANEKVKAKVPEVQSALTTLTDFLSTYKRMQVLLDVNLAGMSEEDCGQEKGNVSQFNQNALEHLDGVSALLKKVKGWLA